MRAPVVNICMLLSALIGVVWGWYDGSIQGVDTYRNRNIRQRNRHHHRISGYQNDWAEQSIRSPSYSRTWDNIANDWDRPVTRNVLSNWEDDRTPSPLEDRVRPSQPKTEIRGVWHSYQAGSARIPYKGATVNIVPNRGRKKAYRGAITTTVIDGPNSRRRSSHSQYRDHSHHKLKPKVETPPFWDDSVEVQDEPVRPKMCARCPGDRAVVAKRGANSVIMESPPVIPCYYWSSVNGVRHEVVSGPRPGSIIREGSHKVVSRLVHGRRVLATCRFRYNVIVRKCGTVEVGPGVKAHCPQGNAWGASCNMTCEDGYQLDGPASSECTDNLEWSGVMPQCVENAPTMSDTGSLPAINTAQASTSCSVPVSPENGHLSCRIPQQQPVRQHGMLPDGTVCHYRCDTGYNIPESQSHLATVRCVAGDWDSSQDPTCVESNSLYDREVTAIADLDELSRSEAEDTKCPKDLCKNGGKCYIILSEALCYCKQGYSGPDCSYYTPDIPNAIT